MKLHIEIKFVCDISVAPYRLEINFNGNGEWIDFYYQEDKFESGTNSLIEIQIDKETQKILALVDLEYESQQMAYMLLSIKTGVAEQLPVYQKTTVVPFKILL